MSMSKLITFAAVAASAAIPMAANAEIGTINIHGVTWTVNTNMTMRTATLGDGSSACIDTSTAIDASKIPWSFFIGEGDDAIQYTVTAIAVKAFLDCTKLSGTLTIPDTVTSAGNYAFKNCTGLTELASLGNITTIPSEGFNGCRNLNTYPDMSKVSTIGKNAFLNCSMDGEVDLASLSGNIQDSAFNGAKITKITFPRRAVAINGNTLFNSCVNLKGVYFPGPDDSGVATIRKSKCFAGCTSLRVFLAGPRTGVHTQYGSSDANMFQSVSGCTIFVPVGNLDGGANYGSWDDYLGDDAVSGNTVLRYGEGRELDFAFDHNAKSITAVPATTHALTNVLSVAATIKSEFGYDVRVSVTNTLDLTDVTITEDMVSGVTFDRLMFSAKTQNQLNAILGAFPATTPISIDPTGLTENMVIPETYPNVFVKTVPGVTIKRTASGFMIIFY